jgi:hypothetical protein
MPLDSIPEAPICPTCRALIERLLADPERQRRLEWHPTMKALLDSEKSCTMCNLLRQSSRQELAKEDFSIYGPPHEYGLVVYIDDIGKQDSGLIRCCLSVLLSSANKSVFTLDLGCTILMQTSSDGGCGWNSLLARMSNDTN